MHLAFKVVIPVVIYQNPVVITLPYLLNILNYQVLTYQSNRFKILSLLKPFLFQP